MNVDRRDCLKVATVTAGSLLLPVGVEAEVQGARFPLHKKINRGRLDPESVAITQLCNTPLRLRTVRYRAAGSDRWEEKSWEWTIGGVANRIKATRDATFIEKNPQAVPVNRTEAIAWLGGAANNN